MNHKRKYREEWKDDCDNEKLRNPKSSFFYVIGGYQAVVSPDGIYISILPEGVRVVRFLLRVLQYSIRQK